MPKKNKIIILIIVLLLIILGIGYLVVKQMQKRSLEKEQEKLRIYKVADYESQRNYAIRAAQELFEQKKAQGIDMSKGPCLSEEIIKNWVVDIAHSPRQDMDNKPENQCQAYREGKAKHFVELDEDGNVIEAQ